MSSLFVGAPAQMWSRPGYRGRHEHHKEGKAWQGAEHPACGIGAALGSVLVLSGEKDEPRLVSHCKGHPDACGKLEPDFYLAIEDVASPDGVDTHWGLTVTYKTVEQVDQPQSPKQRVREVGQQILAILGDYQDGLSANALRPLVGKQNALIPTALELLRRAGSIEVTEVTGRGGKHDICRAIRNSERGGE